VSEVVAMARRAVETIRVTVVGEVSELTDKPGYKAVYFSICDGESTLPCLMWKDAYERCGTVLECGMMVELSGGLTVYVKKGRLQFQVKTVAPAGEGVLRMQVAALARRLDAEGLTATARKRALPVLPARIGLVTSPRGKAVHDVIRTLRRRYPLGELVVAGVAVEGAGAAAEIVRGIRAVASEQGMDVLVVCRGGGSYEDLMPFNTEEVARAIADSPVPVVTGIGHEPDQTIADMVADQRASTPTAAAEAVAPSVDELERTLQRDARSLARSLSRAAGEARQRMDALASRKVLREPMAVLAPHAQRLDLVADGLTRALPVRTARDREWLRALARALGSAGDRTLERAGARVGGLGDRLRDLSPVGVLERGYAICYGPHGVVRTAGEVDPGDELAVRLGEGRLGCTVDTVEEEE
jgi:exodeoxyribonuclease VII large subunit